MIFLYLCVQIYFLLFFKINTKGTFMTKENKNRCLFAIGGGELAAVEEIIEEFINCAGGKQKARIVVMTAATDNPKAAAAKYRRIFRNHGVKDIKAIDINQREDAFRKSALEKTRQATGIFFTGGDQLHITSLMGGTPLHEILREKYESGTVIAGTSAGAAMMSNSMVISGHSDEAPRFGAVELASGLNLLPETIIDTHFSQRGRHGRMIAAVAHYPQHIAIGLDEQTGILVQDGKFRVIGAGVVTVIDGTVVQHSNLAYRADDEPLSIFDLKIHVLPRGYEYDLTHQRPIVPKEIPAPPEKTSARQKKAKRGGKKQKGKTAGA
jgi:cyanophycinase